MAVLPAVRIERNLKLIAHSDLGGAPNVGEGLAMKLASGGRRFFYVAHESAPIAFSVLDVTDPCRPELVWQLPTPHQDVRGNSLALRGDTLLLAYQVKRPGLTPAGFQVFDLSDPASPRELGFFDTSGPHSQGVHLVTCMDGRYAHISTGAADFEPNNPRDHQFYMIVDLEDRARPKEVGRWWIPGQRKGDAEPPLPRHPEPFDAGYRLHHALCYPERPDRAYLGYLDGGFMVLDISDRSHPRMLSRIDYHPPFPGFTHTVLPLFERGLLVVTDESISEQALDWPKRMWIVDARLDTNPIMISSAPMPQGSDELRRTDGRIGAHNVHENEPEPGSAKLQQTIASTWFSAGVRIYDIADPFRPEEIAAFVPETPPGQRGTRNHDVYVDHRGLHNTGDSLRGGLYILEYTGQRPLE
ncbi:MAG: hypothetical protein HY690_14495 [Chloroflexi bacterium]|nr:hypothetical protein [Chloroflexota bacterium]